MNTEELDSKLMKSIFHRAAPRGAPELGSGRNPDFLEFRFRPEINKKSMAGTGTLSFSVR
jgi:hypothetical protein